MSQQSLKPHPVPAEGRLKDSDAAGTAGTHLLQRGRAQLNGDVLELPVPLRAEVPDHVRVLVRFSQQLNLAVGETEALGEDPLDGHVTVVEHAPAGQGAWLGWEVPVGGGNDKRPPVTKRPVISLTAQKAPTGPVVITSLPSI